MSNIIFRAVGRHFGAWGRVGPLLPRWEASGTSLGPEPHGDYLRRCLLQTQAEPAPKGSERMWSRENRELSCEGAR